MKNRIELIEKVPRYGRVIELGVAKGQFTEQMARRRPDVVIYGIDRWTDHHNEEEYQQTLKRLEDYYNVHIFRTSFNMACPLFPHQLFDMVYIDGYAHTGQDEGRTISNWWPKVKPKGIFAGHDYCPKYQPTMDQVNKFTKSHNLELNVTGEIEPEFPSWWVVK
jgi:trans-aconitate methyltransferase